MLKHLYTPTCSYLGLAMVLACIIHGIMLFGIGIKISSPQAAKPYPHPIELILLAKEDAPSKQSNITSLPIQALPQPHPFLEPPSPILPTSILPPTKTAPVVVNNKPQLKSPTPAPVVAPQIRLKSPPNPTRSTSTSKPTLSGAELMARGLALARFNEEQINRPYLASSYRSKQITSATQDFLYQSYMGAWRRKVERIGKLNYPEEAKRKGLHGTLRLEVRLSPKGELLEIRLLKSSGHQILDKAARRIVTLAAPFASFPASMKAEIDELRILRNWQFQKTNRIVSP